MVWNIHGILRFYFSGGDNFQKSNRKMRFWTWSEKVEHLFQKCSKIPRLNIQKIRCFYIFLMVFSAGIFYSKNVGCPAVFHPLGKNPQRLIC